MKIYMKVTKDEYQLPVAVADSVRELAKMVGVTPEMVHHLLSAHKKGISKSCMYVCVEVDDDEQKGGADAKT